MHLIFKAFHSKAGECTLCSNAHKTFFKMHMLGYKTDLNKCKKTEISSILSDHNGTKIEINYRKKKLERKTHGG